MFVPMEALNANGKLVLEAHKKYHAEQDEFIRSCIFNTIRSSHLCRCTHAQEAFKDPDPEKLRKEIEKISKFMPDNQSIFESINKAVNEAAPKFGLDRFQTGFEVLPKIGPCFVIARNICTKPTQVMAAAQTDAKEILPLFYDGHIQAIIKHVLYPRVLKVFEDKRKDYRIDVSLMSPRKYMYGVRIKFLIPYNTIIASSDVLLEVAEDLKTLDTIKDSSDFYF